MVHCGTSEFGRPPFGGVCGGTSRGDDAPCAEPPAAPRPELPPGPHPSDVPFESGDEHAPIDVI